MTISASDKKKLIAAVKAQFERAVEYVKAQRAAADKLPPENRDEVIKNYTISDNITAFKGDIQTRPAPPEDFSDIGVCALIACTSKRNSARIITATDTHVYDGGLADETRNAMDSAIQLFDEQTETIPPFKDSFIRAAAVKAPFLPERHEMEIRILQQQGITDILVVDGVTATTVSLPSYDMSWAA